MKIRAENDFTVVWELMFDEITPRDMTGVFNEQLMLKRTNVAQEIPFTRVANVIHIEFSPNITSVLGDYSIEYRFNQPDPSFLKGYKGLAVDADAFTIVPKTAQAEKINNINIKTVLK